MTLYWPYPPLNTLPGKIQKKESPIDKQAENNPNKNNKLDGLDLTIIQPNEEIDWELTSGEKGFIHEVKLLGNCRNTPHTSSSLTQGAIATIPVILAKFTTQISSAFFIKLPEIVLEIKNVKNKVRITKSILLQDTNIVYIKGFIEKKITYTTMSSFNYIPLTPNLRYCTFNIPFCCFTSITYNGALPLPLVPNVDLDFSFLNPMKDFQLNGLTYHHYNQKPYCEIENSKIVETNQIVERSPWINTLPFTRIEEKMVLLLTFNLLQKQTLKIPQF